MKILLLTPPMTQMNSPYPATAYLSAHLRKQGHEVQQMDLGLALFLKIFSKSGLQKVFSQIEQVGVGQKLNRDQRELVGFFRGAAPDYIRTIEEVVRFLQGRDPSLALRIVNRSLLPEGPRFAQVREHESHIQKLFGDMGLQDRAKHLASLYLDDLADLIKQFIDPDFEFSRYGEKLCASQGDYSVILQRLNQESLIDQFILEILVKEFSAHSFDFVGLTVPFPGNLLAALRVGRWFHQKSAKTKVLMGGGFVNTELRQISDVRLFDEIDALVFDDGEKPFDRYIEFAAGKADASDLIRTALRANQQVQFFNLSSKENHSFKESVAPDYAGIALKDYLSLLELPNPVHRMWSDFRWNKMILAHGCYWKKCQFCDISLDYISRFEPATAVAVVDAMEKIKKETGTSGFHFVDEAAPPSLLRQMSQEILRRGLAVTWWGNLRFDVQFDEELAQLMADAGCVAVTGGLEVASPRILKLINKGISVEQVAKVTKNLNQAGILVHAYLMYGFPSQTEQETVDSLEVVRQLFKAGCLSSAHWHRFTATAHSPVGRNPEKFGIHLSEEKTGKHGRFARNELPFTDSVVVDHDSLGQGLRKALYNYMHGLGLEEDVRAWFEAIKAPKTSLPKNHIQRALLNLEAKNSEKSTSGKAKAGAFDNSAPPQ